MEEDLYKVIERYGIYRVTGVNFSYLRASTVSVG